MAARVRFGRVEVDSPLPTTPRPGAGACRRARLLRLERAALSPLAALQATRARSPAVTEANWSGANAGALALTRRSDVTSRSELGLQVDADRALAGVPVTGYVRAAWAHYFQRDAGLTASFAATGAEIGRNSALVSAGVAAKLSERVSLGLNLDGELSDRDNRIGGSARSGSASDGVNGASSWGGAAAMCRDGRAGDLAKSPCPTGRPVESRWRRWGRREARQR